MVATDVAYPTDSGLLAKAIGSMARTVERIKAGARPTRTRGRRRWAGRRACSIAAKAAADNSIVTRPRPRCSISPVNWPGPPKPPCARPPLCYLAIDQRRRRDRIIPSLGVIDAVGEGNLVLRQLAPGVTAEDVIAATSVEFAV